MTNVFFYFQYYHLLIEKLPAQIFSCELFAQLSLELIIFLLFFIISPSEFNKPQSMKIPSKNYRL